MRLLCIHNILLIIYQGGKPGIGKFRSSFIGINVRGSAYGNGCMVDGMCATAAD